MKSKPEGKALFVLGLTYLILLFVLGIWWLYLILNLSKSGQTGLDGDITSMVKWEGMTFLVLLLMTSITLGFLHFRNQKKTKALTDFFAGLTHELKTPLASIRLQSEVIEDIISKFDSEDKKVIKLNQLSKRLIQDSTRLEIQMEKLLQLSRLERGGTLHLAPINLMDFLSKKILIDFPEIKIKGSNEQITNALIQGDELALELIFKNLIENTKNHTKSDLSEIIITLRADQYNFYLSYRDGGTFTGDLSKIGTLFYKHHSARGSGIGLYLIGELTKHMNGRFDIISKPAMEFTFAFPLFKEAHVSS